MSNVLGPPFQKIGLIITDLSTSIIIYGIFVYNEVSFLDLDNKTLHFSFAREAKVVCGNELWERGHGCQSLLTCQQAEIEI